ncbi:MULTISPECIES: helix-turn-helix domain-containing protein [Kitasatospora]|uniref:Pyridoxamine 5'-phosphate oxidase family protein n=1 Tax=Kitasatospora cystarginea TaxID=58350 RepID=A0ABN3DFD0_9ACTN
MNEKTESEVADVRSADRVAVAQRITDRMRQLGLTEDDLANHAAMAPGYLRHLIRMGPDFDPGGFLRIAAALRLTYRELVEGRTDAPPGQTGPAPRPVLIHLAEPECWEKLGTHGVGRIALPVRPGPAIYPVNYTIDSGTVVYPADRPGGSAPEAGTAMSFEADHIDDRLSQGWSVLITGTAEYIEDADTVARISRLPGAESWAGGSHPLWVRIRPERTTGRRIGTT